MDYNTTREHLKLPEYGRMVQEMVAHALTIENREERQAYAQLIIHVMKNLNPQMKNVPDYEHKLWDHLALMANYELDIDYPFEVERVDKAAAPSHVGYPGNPIRYRHYGHLVEDGLKQIAQLPEGEEREALLRLIANRMKRNLAEWKGDGIKDEKVEHDIAQYTNGQLTPDFSRKPLENYQAAPTVATSKKKGNKGY